MSVAFFQGLLGTSNQGFNGTPTATSTSFTPAGAGDAIIIFAYDDVNNSRVLTFAGTGTYVSLSSGNFGGSVAIGGNGSTSAGAQTFSVTANAAERTRAIGLDYSGSASITGSMLNRATPGIGTDAITGTSVVVPSGGMLVAICVDRTDPAGLTIAAGSAASASRGTGHLTGDYPYIFEEYVGTGAAVQPTFTDTTSGATDNYIVGQWVITPSTGFASLPIGGLPRVQWHWR